MTDIITDSINIQINILNHGNCVISNVVAPTEVYVGDTFNIEYDCTNNDGSDMCYGRIIKNGTTVVGSRWDQELSEGESITNVTPIVAPSTSGTVTFTIEVGYTK